MKKTKKQGQNLSNEKIIHRRKLRSSNPDYIENKIHPIKKERKKRIKKHHYESEQDVTILQTIEGKINSSN